MSQNAFIFTLKEIDLNHGRIEKIEGLERFTKVQVRLLSCFLVQSSKVLPFEKICFRQNLLTKIENLHSLASTLVELDFYDNQITKIENLKLLVNLE